jgi:hypothetical protein
VSASTIGLANTAALAVNTFFITTTASFYIVKLVHITINVTRRIGSSIFATIPSINPARV